MGRYISYTVPALDGGFDLLARMGYNAPQKRKGGARMAGQIFNPENGLFRTVDRIADTVGLSVLWLVCSLPLVTIGPATAALYYSAVKCVRRGEGHTYGNFFRAFRENLRAGAITSLVLLPVLLLLLWGRDICFTAARSGSQAAAVLWVAYSVVMVIPLGVLWYAFPLLSRFTLGPGQLLQMFLRLCIKHLPTTVGLVLFNGALVFLTVNFWMFLPMLVTPGIGALGSSLLLERVFKRYTPDTAEEEGQGTPWYLK